MIKGKDKKDNVNRMSMYKIYIKQAWALIRQERFFSSVYIVGTGLAISMVMALAVASPYTYRLNIAPEVHRDRMCYLSNVTSTRLEWHEEQLQGGLRPSPRQGGDR